MERDHIELEVVPEAAIKYPSLRERVIAILLDNITVLLFFFLVTYISGEIIAIHTSLKPFIFFGILFLYEPITNTYICTIGQFLMGFRIRRVTEENKRINFFQALVRLLFKYTLGWLSFVTITFNPQRRAIHDYATGSVALNTVFLKKYPRSA